jgi:hypothetical protein
MGKAIVLIGPRQLVKQPWFMLLKDIPFLFFWMVISVVAQTLAKANTETLKV